MIDYKHFPFMILLVALILTTPINASNDLPENDDLKGKDSIYGTSSSNNLLREPSDPSSNANCIDKCIKQNQMASVGLEVIEKQCVQDCDLDDILYQVKSQNISEYKKGVKALCVIDDPRTIQPLITALQKDIKARTGLWASIIPALGRLGDPSAVPVLEHTLLINDDHWLGREMSANALGNIGATESIPALLTALDRGYARGPVIEALAKFDDHRVISALISALQPEEDTEITQVAMTALQRFGAGPVPELIDAFNNFSPEYSATQERLKICHLLGKSGDERAIKRLRESLKDPDAIIKKCALEYISKI